MAKGKKKASTKGKAGRKRTLSVKKRRVKDLDAAGGARGGALSMVKSTDSLMVKSPGSMVKVLDRSVKID
jgi:hypothetical protein